MNTFFKKLSTRRKNAKRNLKKSKNGGFSLVELIVVVMIIAILAVSLAPQVMKWVATSRVSSDISTVDSLISSCQTAMVDVNGYKAVKAQADGYTLVITSTGTTVYQGKTATAVNEASDNFYKALLSAIGASQAKVDSSHVMKAIKLTSAAEAVYVHVMADGIVAYEKVTNSSSTPVLASDENNLGQTSAAAATGIDSSHVYPAPAAPGAGG